MNRSILIPAVLAVLAWCAGQALAGEPGLQTLPPAQYVVVEPSTSTVPVTTAPVTQPPDTARPPVEAGWVAEIDTSPRRGIAQQVTETIPPPPPSYSAGDCSSWAAVFAFFGATQAEIEFFIPRIIRRESQCGLDTLNESTGDSGVCQINPIHNRSGWFGGREWGDGGWLEQIHGLRTRRDTASIHWAGACLTLYRVCGSGPWVPPYSCANRRIL